MLCTCAISPIEILKSQDFDVYGFFYKSNIHPFSEMQKRMETLEEYAKKIKMKIIYEKRYGLEKFLQDIVFREKKRCEICYYKRLMATYLVSKKGNFDFFSSTLLYSKFQKHNLIKKIGNSLSKKFFYYDFRKGWSDGIKKSKEMNMYRQQYCGCIYSESIE